MGKRLTDSEFKERVNQKQGNRFEIVSSYHGLHQNVKIKCKKCGWTWNIEANNLVTRQLADCKGVPAKHFHCKSQLLVEKLISKMQKNRFIVVGTYHGAKENLKLKCTQCGYSFLANASNAMNHPFKGCPICNLHMNGRALTEEAFAQKLKEMRGNDIKIMGNFVNCNTRLQVQCTKCGQEFSALPETLLHNRQSKCGHHVQKKNTQEFNKEVFNIYGRRIKILSKYINSKTPILIQCTRCGKAWEAMPCSILDNNHPIIDCCGNAKKHIMPLSEKQFIARMNAVQRGNFKLLSSYSSYEQKVKVLYKPTNEVMWKTPDQLIHHFFANKVSKGELCVKEYMLKNNFKFKTQFTFLDCKDKSSLPFDFAVFNRDGSLNSLIEYQGCQHFIDPFQYKKNDFFNKESVLKTQKHDAMKLSFCQKHGIKLIYINHPQTTSESNKHSFIANLVKRTLDKELKVS